MRYGLGLLNSDQYRYVSIDTYTLYLQSRRQRDCCMDGRLVHGYNWMSVIHDLPVVTAFGSVTAMQLGL